MNDINYNSLLAELRKEANDRKTKELLDTTDEQLREEGESDMGLPNNAQYKTTAHFRQRLAERFNIHGVAWQQFMRRLYPKLTLMKDYPTQHGKNCEVYISKEDEIIVVVDPKNKNLITIFKDPDSIEQEIIQNIETQEQVIAEEEYSLSDFANTLLLEEQNLRTTNNFRYTQRVIQAHKDLMDEYTDLYQVVSEAEPSPELINKMNRFRKLEKKVHRVFGSLDLPREDS